MDHDSSAGTKVAPQFNVGSGIRILNRLYCQCQTFEVKYTIRLHEHFSSSPRQQMDKNWESY